MHGLCQVYKSSASVEPLPTCAGLEVSLVSCRDAAASYIVVQLTRRCNAQGPSTGLMDDKGFFATGRQEADCDRLWARLCFGKPFADSCPAQSRHDRCSKRLIQYAAWSVPRDFSLSSCHDHRAGSGGDHGRGLPALRLMAQRSRSLQNLAHAATPSNSYQVFDGFTSVDRSPSNSRMINGKGRCVCLLLKK